MNRVQALDFAQTVLAQGAETLDTVAKIHNMYFDDCPRGRLAAAVWCQLELLRCC